MEVKVEDRLKRGLAVTQENIDALAGQAGAAKRSGHVMTHRPHVSARRLIEVFETYPVLARDDEQVPSGHWKQVHEDNDDVILVDNAGLSLTGCDGAEIAPVLTMFRAVRHMATMPVRPLHCHQS